jgi:hypothetical protein
LTPILVSLVRNCVVLTLQMLGHLCCANVIPFTLMIITRKKNSVRVVSLSCKRGRLGGLSLFSLLILYFVLHTAHLKFINGRLPHVNS